MMKREEFNCQQCGKCCQELYGGADFGATDKDRERWKDQDRLTFTNRGVEVWLEELIDGITGDIWMLPDGSDEYHNCPFLKKIHLESRYKCLLQLSNGVNYKPEVCRGYPFNKDGTIRPEVANICPEVRRLVALQEATI